MIQISTTHGSLCCCSVIRTSTTHGGYLLQTLMHTSTQGLIMHNNPFQTKIESTEIHDAELQALLFDCTHILQRISSIATVLKSHVILCFIQDSATMWQIISIWTLITTNDLEPFMHCLHTYPTQLKLNLGQHALYTVDIITMLVSKILFQLECHVTQKSEQSSIIQNKSVCYHHTLFQIYFATSHIIINRFYSFS